MNNAHKVRYAGYGVLFIVFLVAIVVLSIAEFNRDFQASTSLRVRAPRAGLLLDDGSASPRVRAAIRGGAVGAIAVAYL